MSARRAQLQWRCRRGTKELDLLMQNWLAQCFDAASEAERETFIRLLDWPDDALIRLVLGQDASGQAQVDALASQIRTLSLSHP